MVMRKRHLLSIRVLVKMLSEYSITNSMRHAIRKKKIVIVQFQIDKTSNYSVQRKKRKRTNEPYIFYGVVATAGVAFK